MRTFHTGGVAGMDITAGLPRVEELFEARVPKGKARSARSTASSSSSRPTTARAGSKVTSRETFDVPIRLPKKHERLVAEGDAVEADQLLARLDGRRTSVEEVRAPDAGRHRRSPTRDLSIVYEDVEEREYPIAHSAKLMVENGEYIRAGQQLTDGPAGPAGILRTRGRRRCSATSSRRSRASTATRA